MTVKKKNTNYYKIILFQKFLISFQAYTLSKNPKTAIFHNLKLEGKREGELTTQ